MSNLSKRRCNIPIFATTKATVFVAEGSAEVLLSLSSSQRYMAISSSGSNPGSLHLCPDGETFGSVKNGLVLEGGELHAAGGWTCSTSRMQMRQSLKRKSPLTYSTVSTLRISTRLWPRLKGTIAELLRLLTSRKILILVEEGLVLETGKSYRLDTTRSCPRGIPAGRANQGLDASTRPKQ